MVILYSRVRRGILRVQTGRHPIQAVAIDHLLAVDFARRGQASEVMELEPTGFGVGLDEVEPGRGGATLPAWAWGVFQ